MGARCMLAHVPICPPATYDTAVYGLSYPSQAGTNLEGAAFSVDELKQATNQAECLKVEEPPPHVGVTARNEIINKIPFSVTETDGVAAGNFQTGFVYRTFHRKLCYELAIRISSFSLANADPGAVKDFDYETVQRTLQSVLESFAFFGIDVPRESASSSTFTFPIRTRCRDARLSTGVICLWVARAPAPASWVLDETQPAHSHHLSHIFHDLGPRRLRFLWWPRECRPPIHTRAVRTEPPDTCFMIPPPILAYLNHRVSSIRDAGVCNVFELPLEKF